MLPIVTLLPLGLAYAKFGPRTYVAKSLMLLQETARDFPSSHRDLPGFARMQDRIAGLQALLKSDRVLLGALSDITGDQMSTDPDKVAGWIRDLSTALTLTLVGTDFLQFELKGSEPKGMGKQLEAVTSNFLEALLSTPDALNATQVLLSRRKEELDAVERKYAQFKEQAGRQLPSNYRSYVTQLTGYQQRLKEKTRELSALGTELEKLRKEADARQLTPLERGEKTKVAQLAERDDGPIGPTANTQDSQQPPAELIKLQGAEARYLSLQSEVARLTESANRMQRKVDEYAPIERELRAMEAEVQLAREGFQNYASRYSPPPASMRAPGILNAPERIKLIDAPRDPEFPLRSAFMIAMASAVASILAALGLVFLAELLDSKVRRSDELEGQ
jgi:uncharacterized protein involved in exopolysaccharide biosynthesis